MQFAESKQLQQSLPPSPRLPDALQAYICSFLQVWEHVITYARVCSAWNRVAKTPASWRSRRSCLTLDDSMVAATQALTKFQYPFHDIEVRPSHLTMTHAGALILLPLASLTELSFGGNSQPNDSLLLLLTGLADRAVPLKSLSLTLSAAQLVPQIARFTGLEELELLNYDRVAPSLTALSSLRALRSLHAGSLLRPAELEAFADAGMPLTNLTLNVTLEHEDAELLERFSSLRQLTLSADAPSALVFYAPPSLTELTVENQELSGGASLWDDRFGVGQLTQLRALHVSTSYRFDGGLEALVERAPASLRTLRLNVDAPDGLPLLAPLTQLERLELGSFAGSISPGTDLKGLTSVTELDLQWKIRGAALEALAALPRLRWLRVWGSDEDSADLKPLVGPLRPCRSLRALVLDWCSGFVRAKRRPLIAALRKALGRPEVEVRYEL